MIGVGSALISLFLVLGCYSLTLTAKRADECLLMDQMDWEEEKLYVQFSTIYLLKQTVKN